MGLRKIFRLASIVIMALALTACNNAIWSLWYALDNDVSTTQSIELAQTVSYEDPDTGFNITVNYPEGWVSNTDDGITLANSEDILTLMEIPNSVPTADQIGGELIILDATTLEILELSADDLSGVITFFNNYTFEFGEITETEINGITVASATATSPIGETDETANFFLAVISVEGGIVFGSFASGSGGIGDFADTIRAIVASAEVTGLSAE